MNSGFLEVSADRPVALARSIEARLVADLFYHAKGVVFGTLVLFAINLTFYQGVIPGSVLSIWSMLILGSCAVRVLSLVRSKRAERERPAWLVHREIVFAYVVMAVGWGLLGVYSVVFLPDTQSIVAIVTVAGVTGSAAATTSASPVIFRAVAYLALAPLAVAALLSSHEALPYVGAMSACYLVVLNRASARIHETLLQNVTFGLENEGLVETLAHQSTIDWLTGLSNRRALNREFEIAWASAAELDHSVALVLCDIDHFKEYNDAYGHLEGDYCLQRVATALEATTRSSDLKTARYGGEEFAVLLPSYSGDIDELGQISERLRTAVQALAIPHRESPVASQVTISVGASYLSPGPLLDIDELIKSADGALYLAKESGRNAIQISHARALGQN